MWLDITEEDVEACFGLPYNLLLEELRADFDLSCALAAFHSLTGQAKRIKDGPSGHKLYEDKFKRYFVLQAVSSIFARTRNSGCKYTLMKSLVNVQSIGHFCKYVNKSLWERLAKWMKNPKAHFDGPLILLLICYLDRVAYMDMFENKRNFPLVSNWTDNMASERIKQEKQSMGFGAGKLRPRIQVPSGMNVEGSKLAATLTRSTEQEMNIAMKFQEIMVNRMGPMMKDLSDLFEEARSYGMTGYTAITFFKNYGLMLSKMAAQPPPINESHRSDPHEASILYDDEELSTQEASFWNSKELIDAMEKAT